MLKTPGASEAPDAVAAFIAVKVRSHCRFPAVAVLAINLATIIRTMVGLSLYS